MMEWTLLLLQQQFKVIKHPSRFKRNTMRKTTTTIKLFAILAISATSFANAQLAPSNPATELGPSKQLDAPVSRNIGGQNNPIRNVVGAPICPSINSFGMVDMGFDKILLDWSNSSSFDSIYFRLTPSGSGSSRVVGILGNPNPGRYFIQGLLSQTTYDIEMSTKCNGTISSWSSPITLTTLPEPGPRFANNGGHNNLQMNITPNPANDQIKIIFGAISAGINYQLRIVDQSGRVVYSTNIISILGTNVLPLNTSSLAPGIYFVGIRSDVMSSVDKLIIL